MQFLICISHEHVTNDLIMSLPSYCKVALISCGYKNKYGHPSVETLKTLENLHINTLCTSDCGSIAMYSLFHFSFVVTNYGMFGIIWT